jgi:hypothetical protein
MDVHTVNRYLFASCEGKLCVKSFKQKGCIEDSRYLTIYRVILKSQIFYKTFFSLKSEGVLPVPSELSSHLDAAVVDKAADAT